MTQEDTQTWWQEAGKGFLPWQDSFRRDIKDRDSTSNLLLSGQQGHSQDVERIPGSQPWFPYIYQRKGAFLMWAWMTVSAYTWNAGFQQFAATRESSVADWSTLGFALPVLIVLVLSAFALLFDSLAIRRTLAALSLFLIHIFTNNLVTVQSMAIETAVAAVSALPVSPSLMPLGVPLAAAIVLVPLRNTSPRRLNVYLPLGKHQKVWGNQAAHGSASTDLAPAFSRIPPLELPRSVPSRVRVRTCSMRCAPQFLVLSKLEKMLNISSPEAMVVSTALS